MSFDYDENVHLIFDAASEEAKQLNHICVSPEHVLFTLIYFPHIKFLFELMNIDTFSLREELLQYFAECGKSPLIHEATSSDDEYRMPTCSLGFKKLLEHCCLSCSRAGRTVISTEDLIVGLIEVEDYQDTSFFKSRKVSAKDARNAMVHEQFADNIGKEVKRHNYEEDFIFDDELDKVNNQDEEESDDHILEKCTINLTKQAQNEVFDPFVGQDDIINEVFEVLLRRKKNNILLLGDPGVGKTALACEIANRIIKKQVPTEFQESQLLSLNIMSLVAGTRYRGDFEDRVRQLIQVFSRSKNYILLLDDIQTILSAGASSGNTNDFGDLIKPLLINNDLRCIGTCTFEDFKRFELERSFFRRFHIIEMKEPSTADMLEILEQVREKYELFYGINYSPEIFPAVVELSRKYIVDRFFPDKALDILDSVGSSVKFRNQFGKKKRNGIQVSDIEEAVSKITRRSLTSIKRNELSALLGLETRLKQKIFGQDQPIRKIASSVNRAKAGLNDENRPTASFLLVGPTGVGKTELCKQLAMEMDMHFHRFDMSEYQEQHSVAKFIGSPPGYVGHGQGGLLIDCIRRTPHSVVLFDEIEKAHPALFNLLLQVMDYATITDGMGRKADFRNVILCMTSNAGAEFSIQSEMGFEGEKYKGSNAMKDELKNIFRPEFRNRLDDIIIFNSLNFSHVMKIVQRELMLLTEKLRKKHIILSWKEQVVKRLAEKGFSQMYGARNVKRIISEEVHDALSVMVLRKISARKSKFPQIHRIELREDKNKILPVVQEKTVCVSASEPSYPQTKS